MDAPQQHRILRQVVELSGCPPGEAGALQAATARLCRRDWWPAIERACTAQAGADRVLRIDRLQVDLGTVPPAAWRAAAATGSVGDGAPGAASRPLLAQFEAALAAALAEALPHADEVQTDAELLVSVLHHGVLPWWADAGDRMALRRAVIALQHRPPAAWRD